MVPSVGGRLTVVVVTVVVAYWWGWWHSGDGYCGGDNGGDNFCYGESCNNYRSAIVRCTMCGEFVSPCSGEV